MTIVPGWDHPYLSVGSRLPLFEMAHVPGLDHPRLSVGSRLSLGEMTTTFSFILSLLVPVAVLQDKRTPLHYATIKNRTDCVLHLLQPGANPDQGDKAGFGTDISIPSANAFPEN